MPRVPQYQSPTIKTTGISGRGLNPLQIPGNLTGKTGALPSDRMFETLAVVAKDQLDKANQLAGLGFNNELTKIENELLWGKNGAMTKQGEDVFGMPEQVHEEFQKQAEAIGSKAVNRAQQDMFNRVFNEKLNNIDKQMNIHLFNEKTKYDEEQTSSYVTNEINTAGNNYQDPERIQKSITGIAHAIILHGARTGKPTDWIEQKTGEAISKTHGAVVNRMLANDLDIAAENYVKILDSKTDTPGFTASDRIAIDKAIAEGSLRGKSQRTVDSLFNENPGISRAEGMAEIKKIQNPKLRDLTQSRFEDRLTQNSMAAKEAQDQMFGIAFQQVANRNISPSDVRTTVQSDVWAALRPDQQEALQKIVANPPNDNETWLDFRTLPVGKMGSISAADFRSKYWANFDATHRVKAEELWTAAKKEVEDPSSSAHTNLTSPYEQFVSQLQSNGIIPLGSTKDLGRANQKKLVDLERDYSMRLDQFETNKGGRATYEERNKIIDDITINKVFIQKPFYQFDVEKPTAIVNAKEADKAYVKMADIPEDVLGKIKNLITSKGKPITSDKVERAYALYKLSSTAVKSEDKAKYRQMFDQVIGE